MKIMKIAAVSAVFAAQFALAQFKQTPLPYAYNALKDQLMLRPWKSIIQNTEQPMQPI
jgi:hypothetical protein